ncbi:MAG: response regulator transcription factor [Bacteroidota bacterium]
MKNCTIFIVDDHEIVITGIEAILSVEKEISVIGTATRGREALEKIVLLKPDIVIMDINIPEINGIDLCKQIIEKIPEIRVVFHSSFIDEKTIIAGFDAGAKGYVPKNFKQKDLIEAIHTVYYWNLYLKGIVSEIIVSNLKKSNSKSTSSTNKEELTQKEIEIVKFISKGLLNKQIAAELNVSQRTIETYKSAILKKLNLNGTAELVVYAIKNSIIEI